MQRDNDIEALIQLTFDIGMAIHQEVGAGLVESVYERVLQDRLQFHNVRVDRQQPVRVNIYGKSYDDAFRYDLLLNFGAETFRQGMRRIVNDRHV
jgi:GxxExxY protein